MQERRKFVRVKGLQEVKFKVKNSKDNPRSMAVKDMSLVGINLYADAKLEKGVILEMQLELPNESDSIHLDGEVLWQLPSYNKRFATGVRFKHKDEQVKERLSKFIFECAKRIDEVREFVRCDLETTITCSYLDSPEEKFNAKTIDISRGGMKLALKKPIEAGSQLQLIFTLPKSNEVIECEIKVVWSRAEDNGEGFAAGIIFTKLGKENKNRIWKFIQDYCRSNPEV